MKIMAYYAEIFILICFKKPYLIASWWFDNPASPVERRAGSKCRFSALCYRQYPATSNTKVFVTSPFGIWSKEQHIATVASFAEL